MIIYMAGIVHFIGICAADFKLPSECLCMGAFRSYSFIYSGYFYSASSSPLLLRGAPHTAWIPHRSFTPKRHRQLRVKDLPKIPTWQLVAGLEPTTFRTKDRQTYPPNEFLTVKHLKLYEKVTKFNATSPEIITPK